MIQTFIQVYKLLLGIREGFRNDESFRALFYLMLSMLIVGSLFYWRTEGWSILDSFYFCVMTISTIGYGDLTPTTPLSKIFTIVFAILGVGVFVSVVSKLVEAILRREMARKEKHINHIQHMKHKREKQDNKHNPK